MHILYIDESGVKSSNNDPGYFILAGVAVLESQVYWLSRELDNIACRIAQNASMLKDAGEIELHGSHMFSGKGFWRKQPKPARRQAIAEVLRVLAGSNTSRMFASVIRQDPENKQHPMEKAFMQMASRFDQYLARLSRPRHNADDRPPRQRGLVLFDKSVHETSIQSATTVYRDTGHDWGKIRNLAEVPAFIDSRSSRLIQLADIVAYAIGKKYGSNDDQFYKIIEHKFDADGGRTHGLYESAAVRQERLR